MRCCIRQVTQYRRIGSGIGTMIADRRCMLAGDESSPRCAPRKASQKAKDESQFSQVSPEAPTARREETETNRERCKLYCKALHFYSD